jgi:hypothetical protein
MLSTELEYHCAVFGCFRQSWNTFVQGCKAFDRVGIPLYRVGMVSSRLECILEVWNALYRVAKRSTELEYLCTGLEWFLVGWNAF